MTTAVMTESRAVYTPPSNYRLSGAGLLRSEWTKFWSLRSSWIVLVCAALFGAGVAVAVAATYDSGLDGSPITAVNYPMPGVSVSTVFIAVLGVLFMAGEYSTGSILSTMAAAPKRLGVLWSKTAVFAAIVFTMYAAMVFTTFFVTQALFSGTNLGGVGLGDESVLRVLFGHVVLPVYAGLLGVALGAIIRTSAGAIGFYIGVILVLPNLATFLPWSWVDDVTQYLPGNVSDSLTAVEGIGLGLAESWIWMGIWSVVFFGLATVLIKRRDV